MKNTGSPAQPTSRARRALAENLAAIADLRVRIGPLALTAPKPGRESQAGDVPDFEAERTAEHDRLQQTLAAAVAKRDGMIASVLATEELPRRIKAYQDMVLQVNTAWNDILAIDETMRRRFPAQPSIFNTSGPHARAVIAPSTDRSPVPALPIDSRKLFTAAGNATLRFLDALASNAEARFGDS
jgi:hypothetical protein